MDEDGVAVSYAEGWDADARRPFGPLTRAQAAERDGAGDPYVVLHRLPGREIPSEVHLIAWRDHFVGRWVHDELGRRIHDVDLRLLNDDRLFLRQYVERRYASPEQPDRAPDAWRRTVNLLPGEKARSILEERGDLGGSFHTLADVPEEKRRHSRSGFGVLADTSPRLPDRGREAPVRIGEAPASAWRPPTPMRLSAAVDDLFQPGNPFPVEPWEKTVTAPPRLIATVRVPTGRLAVSEPRDGAARELAERVPPGAYPLQAAVVVGEGEYCGERFPVTEEPAVRLLIRDEPAVTWELALAEGEDPRLLLDGHGYGFGTDTATGGFADAVAWRALAERFRRFHDEEQDDDACEEIDESHVRVADRESGSDLVSFPTGGDGTWPVWLGRSATGATVSVVVVTTYL
ncbi:DUF4241 domain-containing protein [Streptomyces sp. NPDC003832]